TRTSETLRDRVDPDQRGRRVGSIWIKAWRATVTLPYFNWEGIRGLSMGGRARSVTEPKEINRGGAVMLLQFPQILQYALAAKKGDFLVRIAREIISVLDYRKGFGTPIW